MNVIQRLNVEHASRIRYFLSKADTVPNERDRQKVVVQITQVGRRRFFHSHLPTSSSNAATTSSSTSTDTSTTSSHRI